MCVERNRVRAPARSARGPSGVHRMELERDPATRPSVPHLVGTGRARIADGADVPTRSARFAVGCNRWATVRNSVPFVPGIHRSWSTTATFSRASANPFSAAEDTELSHSSGRRHRHPPAHRQAILGGEDRACVRGLRAPERRRRPLVGHLFERGRLDDELPGTDEIGEPLLLF